MLGASIALAFCKPALADSPTLAGSTTIDDSWPTDRQRTRAPLPKAADSIPSSARHQPLVVHLSCHEMSPVGGILGDQCDQRPRSFD